MNYKSKYEYIRFPLIILTVAIVVKGIGVMLLNDHLINYFEIDNNLIFSIAHTLNIFGELIIFFFPMILSLKYLNQRYENERPALMFFISYAMFLATTTLLLKDNLPSVAYIDTLNFKLTNINLNELNQTFLPLKTGFIGVIIATLITRKSYDLTRGRTDYSIISFISKDTLSILISIILSFIVSIVFVKIWPPIIKVLFIIFEWIKTDVRNPVVLMIYGFTERVVNLLDLKSIVQAPFWFSEYGGTWVSDLGEHFVGDVVIWNEQIKNGLYGTGFGRFITPSYIINLFIIPAIIIALYSNNSNRYNRQKTFPILIILILISMFSDLSWPIEIFIAVMAPGVLVFHLFYSGLLYAILQINQIFLGASFSGYIESTSVGNLVDLIAYSKIPELQANVLSIIVLGFISLVIYIFFIRFYYKHLAFGLVNTTRLDYQTDLLIDIVGGVENIKTIDASSFRIDLELHEPQLFDYDRLNDTSIDKAIETRVGYALYYGTASVIISREIEKRIKIEI